ncbi:MAG: O-antigen ligase family protein [Candidatus Sungbacteria bacterium]|nr:O-antigen ligase family protein [bacterium]MDZ4260668.1 O-antigen ligase family protein [Candidatus Sungbacteria bacterium]
MKKLETIFAWIVKIGLFIIPFLPLYVSSSMLFPFITGKNFTFRIITEVIFVFWAWLAIVNAGYRPRLTPLFKIVTIFTAIIFFADLFGANPYRSFFSNYERMEGFMMLGHLYLYYVMLVSVFRRRDWMIFFHSTVIASLIVSYIGLLQKLGLRISMQGGFRVDSTIGNPTYLAAYLLFHIWILLILMYTYRKHWWALSLYAAVFLFELVIVYFTATRGAIIGLVATSIPFAAAVVWQWPKAFSAPVLEGHARHWPLGRKITAAVLGLIIVVPMVFWLSRNTNAVQSNQVLRRLTNYSLQEGTIQARFMIWGQSWRGFLEHPILGWGQENYYLVFQKYYNPALWGDEPWFDRSHNIFFDWMIHAGILGIGAYLAMYGAMYMGIIKGIKKNKVPFWLGSVVLSALSAHIIQNMFVFDNLNTYLLFFAFLGFGSFLLADGSEENTKHIRAGQKTYSHAYAITMALAVFFLIFGYYAHVKPIKQSRTLIQAMMSYQMKVPMDQQINMFKETLAYNSFGTTEAREQIVNIGTNVPGNQRFSNAEQLQYMTFAIDELRKETSSSAKDVKHMIFLGSLLNRLLGDNAEYVLEAKRVLEEAVALSPTKQPIAFELAQYYVLVGNMDGARDVLYRTWKQEPNFRVAGIHTWVLAVFTKKPDIAAEISQVIPVSSLSEIDLLRLGEAYRRVEDFKGAMPIYARLVVVAAENAGYHATYAALLANAGRTAEARVEAKESIRLDPSFGKDADGFLRNLSQ